MKPRATIACAAALLVSGSGMVMGTQSGPAPRISEAVPSVVATPTDMAPPKWEDAKDRPPAIIPLVDLTEGYLWDMPPPAVVAEPVVIDGVDVERATMAADVPMPVVFASGAVWWVMPEHVGFVLDRANAVPEPATWAMMLGGFGLIGVMLRRVRSPS